jgi:glycosyltransferase involved in cell wall biosynthesis
MDLYSNKLAENMSVPRLYTDIYQKVAEKFNISFFSREAFSAAFQDLRFIKKIRNSDGIMHFPNHHFGRYAFFLNTPYIITVHDMIRYFDLKGYGTFIHTPNNRDRFYLDLDYRGIKKATRIIAVSQATKNDIVKYLNIPEERISVVYEGVDHNLFRPTSRRLVNYPYILFVGSEHPRKNFLQLIRAFAKLKAGGRFKDLKLIKVGEAGGPEVEFRKKTLQVIEEEEISSEVLFTEHVPEADLPAYYSKAECFILPSLYEGFGFPPLEAMACGCPVIVSNVTSLPEVTGNAAITVKPDDTIGLAGAIEMVLSDENWRQTLITKGLEHSKQFTWKKAGLETMKVYQDVEHELTHEYTTPATEDVYESRENTCDEIPAQRTNAVKNSNKW